MSDWSIRVDGQPPTVNHLYVRVRGQWNKIAKAPGVEQYQTDIAWLCRAARPSGWQPTGYVKVCYRFHLGRDADCDNLMKAINDALEAALGINDRMFLPCVLEKTIGNKQPYTIIELSDLSQ